MTANVSTVDITPGDVNDAVTRILALPARPFIEPGTAGLPVPGQGSGSAADDDEYAMVQIPDEQPEDGGDHDDHDADEQDAPVTGSADELAQGDPDAAGSFGDGLDEDADTSLVLCIQFHLMSEHSMPDALHLDDEQAGILHARLHAVMKQDHAIGDHRFRPGRAIAALMLQCQREHEACYPPSAMLHVAG